MSQNKAVCLTQEVLGTVSLKYDGSTDEPPATLPSLNTAPLHTVWGDSRESPRTGGPQQRPGESGEFRTVLPVSCEWSRLSVGLPGEGRVSPPEPGSCGCHLRPEVGLHSLDAVTVSVADFHTHLASASSFSPLSHPLPGSDLFHCLSN